MFTIFKFAEKACFDVLCTCKATSLSKMARLFWRYSDDAGAIIENVYKFRMGEKKSGMKLSLNRVWDWTAALIGASRSIAQKIVEEKKKAQDEQQQPKQPPSSTSKVSLDDFGQCVVRRAIASMYSLKKVLPILITSEQSLNRVLVTLAARVVFATISFIRSLLTHAGGESKSADGETRCSPQQDLIPSHGQGVERGGLHR